MASSQHQDPARQGLHSAHRAIIEGMFPEKAFTEGGKSAMREPERQIKTMDFDVEKNDYSVPEFYEHFGKKLPQVIMISQGFFGDIVEDTFDRENIIRIQTVSKQRRVVARADMGDHSKLISIPLTYSIKVCVVKKHKLSKEKTIKEVIEHQSLPCIVEFPRDRTISVDGQNISTNHIPKLQLQKAFDEMYLLGNLIVDGVMGPDVVNVPLYLPQLRMARVIGLKNTSTQKWRGYLEELERFSSYLKYDKEYGNQGIAQYDPSAVHSDAVYAFVEPQIYSNIISVFKHRRGNDGDNTNYLLPKVPPPVPIKPQRPPPQIPEIPGRPKLPERQPKPHSQTPSPTVNITGKSDMRKPKRQIKTMEFDVEKNDYSVPEFYEHFGKELPQVIMISQGFFGDIVEDTFDRENIIRIQTVSKQRRVVARADMGDHSKLISIPLTYSEKVCVVKKHKLSTEKTIKEVIEHQSLPCTVEFPRDRTISVDGQNISTNHIPKLQLQKAFDEMYLLGNLIVDGVMRPDVVNVPLYLSQLRMARVIGLKNTPTQNWRGYLEELERFSSYLKYDKEYGNQGIAQYDPSAVHSDAVYAFVEPQTYSNIISVFQHRRGNDGDNTNYLLPKVPPPVPIKPQRPPPQIPEMPGRPKLPARQSRPPSQTPSPTVKHEVIYTNNLPRAPIRPFQPELKEAIEIVQGKIGVHEPKRLVKTMDFDVEKNDYSVPEFYERFGKELPQVIMISQGFFGDIVEDTFDREMIIRIQTVSKQRRVVARADMGDHSKLISIPLTYPEKVCVVKKHKLSSEKTIKEAIEHQSLPCVVEFPKHRTISVGGQNISTNQIPKLQLQKAFDEMYLLGNFIVDGVMGPDVVNVPLYLSQLRMARVIGLKNAPPQKWRGYLEELERFSSYQRYDNEYGNQGIAQYDPSAVHSDAVYSFVEPQTYSNIISVFQHRLWNVVDNPNYQLTDVNQHEDTKYEEIGMERDSAMHIDKIDNHRPSLSTFGVCRIPAQASTSQISQEVKSTIGSLKSTGSENRSFQESNYSPLIDRNTKVSPPVAIKPPRPPPQIPEIQGSPELPARQPRPPSQMLSPTVKHDAIYTNDVPRTSIRPFQPELKEAIECKQEHSIEYDKQRNTLQSPNRPDLVDKPLPTINDSLDVNKLSINDVCGYLKVLSLDKYEPKFRQEMIDGALMAALSKEDFEKEFGMNGLEAVRIFKFSKEGHLPR